MDEHAARHVFVAGGTGYIGRRALDALLARGHRVRALVRAGSERRLPAGCEIVTGDALDARTFATAVAPCDTFLQLVGTPSPSPSKAAEFERVDWGSLRESVVAAREGGVRHFVYLSVAHPSSVMRAYVDVRVRGEALVRERLVEESGVRATFLRPWYVLGPGHRWPYALIPLYAAMRLFPATRASATRLGLVTLDQMVSSIVGAVERDDDGVRIVDVPRIKASERLAIACGRGGTRHPSSRVRMRSAFGRVPPALRVAPCLVCSTISSAASCSSHRSA